MPEVNEQPVQPGTPRPRRRSRARSANRRTGNRGVWIAIAIVGVAVFALLAFISYGTLRERMAAAEKYDQAKVIIEDADAVVVQVDRVMQKKITEPNLAADATAAAERIPAAREQLEQALEYLEAGQADRTDDEQELAILARATAAARLTMLSEAEKILPYNVKAAAALPQASAGWDAVLEAKKLSDQAVASYNRLNKAGVTKSAQLNKQAAAKLAVAKKSFAAAEKAFPEAGFEAYLTYVEQRIRLNKLSQQSDNAWLKSDVRGANAVIAKYNAADKTAVEQAKKLPATPQAAIAAAYEAAAGAATDAYNAARQQATKADEELRDF